MGREVDEDEGEAGAVAISPDISGDFCSLNKNLCDERKMFNFGGETNGAEDGLARTEKGKMEVFGNIAQ